MNLFESIEPLQQVVVRLIGARPAAIIPRDADWVSICAA